MGKILVIAEKPSVARDIARVLKVNQKGDGCLIGEKYIVSWAIGHLVSLKEPEELNEQYKRWRKEDLPILPDQMDLKVLPKTRSQFQILKRLMNGKDVESLICATDSGREGELIFRYIYRMAGCNKPFQRLWISSMTDTAIHEGFLNLRPGSDYDALYESAKCRSEADWLVGMNASRAFTLRYNVLLSVGRVQTPTLQILIKRRHEIDSFVPQQYYSITADFGDFRGLWFDLTDKEKKITDKAQAKIIAEKVNGKAAIVQKVQKEEKRDLPPQLYDLTSLQRDASSMLGYSADKTLKLAQSLYEKQKLITYPRTDSKYLSHDMIKPVQNTLRSLPKEFEKWTSSLLSKPLLISKRVFDDTKLTDHHAIIPTGKAIKEGQLSEDESKVFDLIARRFVAAFLPAHQYELTKVVTISENEAFSSTGRVVLVEGFKEIYNSQPSRQKIQKKDAEASQLPSLEEGETRIIRKATTKEESTQPPKEHTDASLLSEMEHAGRRIEDETLREQMKNRSLGTPATRAAIIERLIKVGYAKRKGRQIIATKKGVQLIEAVPNEIASPETTGRWEQALEAIAQGNGDQERFLSGIRRLSAFLTEFAFTQAPDVAFEQEIRSKSKKSKSIGKPLELRCPLCHEGKIVENQKAFGCSRWKEGCKFTIWKNCVQRVGGPEISEALLKLMLANENGEVRGSTGTLHYHDGQVGFSPKKIT